MTDATFVYFLRFNGDGPIKIGFSANPEKRLRHIRPAAPFEITLAAKAPGTIETEKALHKHFTAARLRFEWFSPVPELTGLIKDVARTRELPEKFRAKAVTYAPGTVPISVIVDRINAMLGFDLRTKNFTLDDLLRAA